MFAEFKLLLFNGIFSEFLRFSRTRRKALRFLRISRVRSDFHNSFGVSIEFLPVHPTNQVHDIVWARDKGRFLPLKLLFDLLYIVDMFDFRCQPC